MTLSEFIKEMRSDLDRFEADWRKRQEDQPDEWPEEMDAGDWLEQFITFTSTD